MVCCSTRRGGGPRGRPLAVCALTRLMDLIIGPHFRSRGFPCRGHRTRVPTAGRCERCGTVGASSWRPLRCFRHSRGSLVAFASRTPSPEGAGTQLHLGGRRIARHLGLRSVRFSRFPARGAADGSAAAADARTRVRGLRGRRLRPVEAGRQSDRRLCRRVGARLLDHRAARFRRGRRLLRDRQRALDRFKPTFLRF